MKRRYLSLIGLVLLVCCGLSIAAHWHIKSLVAKRMEKMETTLVKRVENLETTVAGLNAAQPAPHTQQSTLPDTAVDPPTLVGYKPWQPPRELTEAELQAEVAAAGERFARLGEKFTLADGTPLLHNGHPVSYSGRPSDEIVRIHVAERMPTHFKQDGPMLSRDQRGLFMSEVGGAHERLGNVYLTIRWADRNRCIYKTVAVNQDK